MSMVQFTDLCVAYAEVSQLLQKGELTNETIVMVSINGEERLTTVAAHKKFLGEHLTDLWATCPDRLRVLDIVALLEKKQRIEVELYTVTEIASAIGQHFNF